jgi:hypothetical protein
MGESGPLDQRVRGQGFCQGLRGAVLLSHTESERLEASSNEERGVGIERPAERDDPALQLERERLGGGMAAQRIAFEWQSPDGVATCLYIPRR